MTKTNKKNGSSNFDNFSKLYRNKCQQISCQTPIVSLKMNTYKFGDNLFDYKMSLKIEVAYVFESFAYKEKNQQNSGRQNITQFFLDSFKIVKTSYMACS